MVGDIDEFVARLARVSMLADMIYWSSTRGRWRHLFEEAVALASPDRDDERADFSAGDLVPGAEIYYWLQEDNPTTGVVYQMVIHERTPDSLVFENVNRTDLRAKFLFIKPKVAEPEEFRQLYYIEREAGDVWRYYSLVRMGRAGTLAGTSEANYRNRAEAYFRFLAGLRMDREPPAAR